jgi:hypothetical protein
MRVTNFLLAITVCLAIAGAYLAGHYVGEADGREAGADATFNLDALRSAEAFTIANSVRQALRESRPAQAELEVVRYAARKAPSLVACSSSPECAASVGRLMPTKAQLAEMIAAERAARNAQ